MKTFEELQNAWQKKEKPADELLLSSIFQKINELRNKNRITTGVLAITMSVLTAYFLWVGFSAPLQFQIGLLLMIGALLTRIIWEISFTKRLTQVPAYVSLKNYRLKIKDYYTSRLRLHQIYTPALLIIYWLGFVMLLPTLENNLSPFWFNYVWISSIPIAIIMILFIRYHIRKEKQALIDLSFEISS